MGVLLLLVLLFVILLKQLLLTVFLGSLLGVHMSLLGTCQNAAIKKFGNNGTLLFSSADTPSLAAQLLECQTDKKSDESKKDTSQVGLELVEYISAANSSK